MCRATIFTSTPLNAATGKEVWRFKSGIEQVGTSHAYNYGISGEPAVVNGIIYIPTDASQVIALNTATGKLVWGIAICRDWYLRDVAVANGMVYVTGRSPNIDKRGIYSLDAATGAVKWHLKSADPVYVKTSGNYAIVDGVIYVNSDGQVGAII